MNKKYEIKYDKINKKTINVSVQVEDIPDSYV